MKSQCLHSTLLLNQVVGLLNPLHACMASCATTCTQWCEMPHFHVASRVAGHCHSPASIEMVQQCSLVHCIRAETQLQTCEHQCMASNPAVSHANLCPLSTTSALRSVMHGNLLHPPFAAGHFVICPFSWPQTQSAECQNLTAHYGHDGHTILNDCKFKAACWNMAQVAVSKCTYFNHNNHNAYVIQEICSTGKIV